jgi:hypothetical protein
VNAPQRILVTARAEAARLGEQDPDINFAACGPETCIVRMRGSFRYDGPSHVPRLDLEIDIGSKEITARALYAGA